MNPAIQFAPVQESATLIAWSFTVSQTPSSQPFNPQCPITGNRTLEKKDSSCSTFRTKPAASVFDLPVCEITSPAVSPHSLTIIGGELSNKLSARVLSRLAEAETREPDAWLRDDYRIAWLTVLHCAEGIADPWRFAFWKYLGKTPEKLIPLFVERRENHRAMEIPDFDASRRRA